MPDAAPQAAGAVADAWTEATLQSPDQSVSSPGVTYDTKDVNHSE